MSSLDVVGGVYHELCLANDWDQIFGSAGRAASALKHHVGEVNLWSYASKDMAWAFGGYAATYGFTFVPSDAPQTISFEYAHSLSDVVLRPSKEFIQQLPPIEVSCDSILRFGMVESTAKVKADRCVYDPQSELTPEPFGANGSSANHLAIVANEAEVRLLGKDLDAIEAARNLLDDRCEVVVVKAGPKGAFVVTTNGVERVPAYKTDFVWTIGTGDIFAAIFAAQWAANKTAPLFAADAASRAVAEYVETMNVEIPPLPELFGRNRMKVDCVPGRVYLAAPFFNLPQRWILQESLKYLKSFGMEVFSPLHEVGMGGDEVAIPDLEGLKGCDRVLALVDGLDSGTLFELGYATRMELPIYALSQSAAKEALVMLSGTGARMIPDFVTAIHWTVWKV